MIHFFGILEPLAGKRQQADEAPGKSAFFGPAFDDEEADTEEERADLEDEARERQHFLLQSFSPQF